MTDADPLDIDALAHRTRPGFEQRVVEVPPGEAMAFDARRWRDAIVFVLDGELDVDCASGVGHRFGRGDILCFARLAVRALRNDGPTPALLLAIRRRTPHR